jgi:hypothetical protein
MLAGTQKLATNQLLHNQLTPFAFYENLRNLRQTKFAFSRKGGKENKDAKRFFAKQKSLLRNQLVSYAFCENLCYLRETKLRFIHFKVMALLSTIDYGPSTARYLQEIKLRFKQSSAKKKMMQCATCLCRQAGASKEKLKPKSWSPKNCICSSTIQAALFIIHHPKFIITSVIQMQNAIILRPMHQPFFITNFSRIQRNHHF